MAFQKGNTEGKGRPKGQPNKTSTELKEFYVVLLSDNTERIQIALDGLFKTSHKDYLMAIDKISQKVVANKKDITSDDKPIQPAISIIEHRTESEADAGD